MNCALLILHSDILGHDASCPYLDRRDACPTVFISIIKGVCNTPLLFSNPQLITYYSLLIWLLCYVFFFPNSTLYAIHNNIRYETEIATLPAVTRNDISVFSFWLLIFIFFTIYYMLYIILFWLLAPESWLLFSSLYILIS